MEYGAVRSTYVRNAEMLLIINTLRSKHVTRQLK